MRAHLVAAVVACVIGGLVAQPAAAVRVKSCGTATAWLNPEKTEVYLYAKSVRAYAVSCRRARRVAIRWLHTSEGNAEEPRPYGYRCTTQASGRVYCAKGTASSISWRVQAP